MPLDDIVVRCSSDDGLYLPSIRRHSLEKIGIHNRYAELFAAAVANKWAQRAYVGLYAGAGRARLVPSNEIVETSAISILKQRHPFTHHVFVDDDLDCLRALEQRATAIGRIQDCQFIHGDVNSSVPRILQALPSYSAEKGLLSFCFVDPFDIKLRFATIRALSRRRMDFLVLLMLGIDARRNLRLYRDDWSSTVVADFIDRPQWREELAASSDRNILRFLATKFDEAMVGLGYLHATETSRVVVKATGKNVPLYVLAFYSKHALGHRLWRAARDSLSPQLDMLLE